MIKIVLTTISLPKKKRKKERKRGCHNSLVVGSKLELLVNSIDKDFFSLNKGFGIRIIFIPKID